MQINCIKLYSPEPRTPSKHHYPFSAVSDLNILTGIFSKCHSLPIPHAVTSSTGSRKTTSCFILVQFSLVFSVLENLRVVWINSQLHCDIATVQGPCPATIKEIHPKSSKNPKFGKPHLPITSTPVDELMNESEILHRVWQASIFVLSTNRQ